MTDWDDRIGRVLRGLGETETPEGMEGRVLARMRAAEGERGRRSEARLGGVGRGRWAWALAAAAGLTVVALVGAGLPGRLRQSGDLPRVAMGPAAVGKAGIPRPGFPAGDRQIRGGIPVMRAVSGRRTVHRAGPAGRQPRRARALTRISLLASGNHPAPEMPLTEEERMLLRVARHGRPEEYAVLNPDARDAQARSDQAEFRKFFGPPLTGDSE